MGIGGVSVPPARRWTVGDTLVARRNLAGAEGLEPPTYGFGDRPLYALRLQLPTPCAVRLDRGCLDRKEL
jgi:hypothetical protein